MVIEARDVGRLCGERRFHNAVCCLLLTRAYGTPVRLRPGVQVPRQALAACCSTIHASVRTSTASWRCDGS